MDIVDEAKVMNIANDYNVPVPKIIKVINDKNIGKGFFMEFIEGETLGNRIVNSDKFKLIRPKLAKRCGEIIANIHKIPISKFNNIKISEAEDELLRYEEVYKTHNQDIPVFEYTISWLKDNIPKKMKKKIINGSLPFHRTHLFLLRKSYIFFIKKLIFKKVNYFLLKIIKLDIIYLVFGL